MPVQINITGADAAESLRELSALAVGLTGGTPVTAAPVTAAAPVVPEAPIQAPFYTQPPAVPTAAQPAQTAVPTAQPTAPLAQPPAAGVPVTAPAYTMDQLGVAAGPLIDAGRSGELVAWLNQRGAIALTQLDPSHYGDFATYLRSLGARI